MLSGLVRESSNTHINERMGKLKELASESIHGAKHPIFDDKTEEQLTEKERLAKVNKQLKQHVKGGRIHNTMIVTPAGSKTDVYTVIDLYLFAIIYNYQNGKGCDDDIWINT